MSDTEKGEASAKRVRFQNIPRPFEDVLSQSLVKTKMSNPVKSGLRLLTDSEPESEPSESQSKGSTGDTEDGMAGVSAGFDDVSTMEDTDLLEERGGKGEEMVFEKVGTDGDGDPLARGLSRLKLGRVSSEASWMVRRVTVLGASCGTPRPVSIGENEEPLPFLRADSV